MVPGPKDLIERLRAIYPTLVDGTRQNSQFADWAPSWERNHELLKFSQDLINAIENLDNQRSLEAAPVISDAILNLYSNPQYLRKYLDDNPSIKKLYENNIILLEAAHQEYQKYLANEEIEVKTVKPEAMIPDEIFDEIARAQEEKSLDNLENMREETVEIPETLINILDRFQKEEKKYSGVPESLEQLINSFNQEEQKEERLNQDEPIEETLNVSDSESKEVTKELEQDKFRREFLEVTKKEDGLRNGRLWNNVVDNKLSPEEKSKFGALDQLKFGTSLALEQYNAKIQNNSTPANAFLVIRNPEQLPNSIIRHAFGQIIPKEMIPELYSMLKEKNFTQGNETITDNDIMKHIFVNIPESLFDCLKDYYSAHIAAHVTQTKPNEGETQEQAKLRATQTAQKEFFNLVMFQFVTSKLIEHSNEINKINNNPTSEQSKEHELVIKSIKNVPTEGGTNKYDINGKLTDVNNPGFGAPIKKEHFNQFVDKMDKAKPIIVEKKSIMPTVDTVIEKANVLLKEELKERYGNIPGIEHIAEALESKDSKKLNKYFKDAMEIYTASELSKTQFKNIVDDFANRGCPTAIFYKGMDLLGKKDVINNMMGVTKMDPLYPQDSLSMRTGIETLNKLQEGNMLVSHVNAINPKTSWSQEDINDLNKIKTQREYSKEFDSVMNDFINVENKYLGKDSSNASFLTGIAHKYFVDPKRKQQIALIQGIINSDMPPDKKLPVLLGAIDVLRSQIGSPKFESRLLGMLDDLEKKLSESYKEVYKNDISLTDQQKIQEFKQHYKVQEGVDPKFKESVLKHAQQLYASPSAQEQKPQKLKK